MRAESPSDVIGLAGYSADGVYAGGAPVIQTLHTHDVILTTMYRMQCVQ